MTPPFFRFGKKCGPPIKSSDPPPLLIKNDTSLSATQTSRLILPISYLIYILTFSIFFPDIFLDFFFFTDFCQYCWSLIFSFLDFFLPFTSTFFENIFRPFSNFPSSTFHLVGTNQSRLIHFSCGGEQNGRLNLFIFAGVCLML